MKGGPFVQLAAATSQLASIVCDRFQGMCLTERVLLCSQTRFYVCARVCRGANTSTHLKTSICFLYFFFFFALCRLKTQGNNVGLDKSNY